MIAPTVTTMTSRRCILSSLSSRCCASGSRRRMTGLSLRSSSAFYALQEESQLHQRPQHTQIPSRSFQTAFDLPDPPVACTATSPPHASELALTKIVATIGPTSEQAEPLREVTQAGMRIMRLNFSHATPEEVELRVTNLKAAQKALTPKSLGDDLVQDCRAILLDTKGPEIRTGKLRDDTSGHETITLNAGDSITLHTDAATRDAGSTATDLFIDYQTLHTTVGPGQKILLDDGAIVLTVVSAESNVAEHGKVVCTVDFTGTIRSRAGVNLPGADTTDLPALSDKDKADVLYGMKEGDIDFVAASFVQTADAVRDIRAHILACAKELNWDLDTQPLPLIISKIETATGLTHFDDILEESDGIMVARGDLGVEIPLVQVTNAQKMMVAACNAAGKPVVVATQMLESMSKAPRPTRAEVSDVTNAVYDGADCVMTSGETAKGKFPTETIQTMNAILQSAERFGVTSGSILGLNKLPRALYRGPQTDDSAVAAAAVAASMERPECVAILVLTGEYAAGTDGSGGENCRLANQTAAHSPSVPILAFCPNTKQARQLQIHKGVHPVAGLPPHSPAAAAMELAKKTGALRSGDEVVIISREGEARTATMQIATVA